MVSPNAGRRRGTIGWLPSGFARVKVYAGVDQLTGKKLWLRETVAARETRRETEREAEKVLTRLLNRVDERRSPRTEATVNELLDRWLEVIDVERTTRTGYVGKTATPASRYRGGPPVVIVNMCEEEAPRKHAVARTTRRT